MVRLRTLLILIFLLSAVFVGCAPNSLDSSNTSLLDSPNSLTGGVDANGRRFTQNYDDGSMDALKRKNQDNPPNRELASRIVSMNVSRLNHQKEVVSTHPIFLRLKFKWRERPSANPTSVVRDFPLFRKGGKIESRESILQGTVTAFIRCDDDDCLAAEIKLSDRSAGAQTALVYRQRRAKIQARVPEHGRLSDPKLAGLARKYQVPAEVDLDTFEVVYGSSRSQFTLNQSDNPDDLICIDSPTVETNQGPISSDQECWSGTTNKDLEVELIGNSRSGDKAFQIKNTTTRERLYFFVDNDEAEDTDQLPKNFHNADDLCSSSTKGIALKNRYCSNRVYGILRKFETGASQKVITTATADWLSNDGPRVVSTRKRVVLQEFINMTAPVLERLRPLFEAGDVPIDLLYITLIEDIFFTEAAVKSQWTAANNHKGAGGPWQLLASTAKEEGGIPPDQRFKMLPATRGAVKYIDTLLKKYRDDPYLTMMAYNTGPGRLGKQIQATAFQLSWDVPDVSAWTLVHYDMVYEETRNYVISIASAWVVGQNYLFHNFRNPQYGRSLPAQVEVLKKRRDGTYYPVNVAPAPRKHLDI